MSAKDIFEKRHLLEAEESGDDFMPVPGMPMPGPGRPGMGRPGMGRPEMMSGPFSPGDLSKLKDVLLLIVCAQARNSYDGDIAKQLMAGKPLEPGQVQHILDEVGSVGNLPESHGRVLQKAFEWLQSSRG